MHIGRAMPAGAQKTRSFAMRKRHSDSGADEAAIDFDPMLDIVFIMPDLLHRHHLVRQESGVEINRRAPARAETVKAGTSWSRSARTARSGSTSASSKWAQKPHRAAAGGEPESAGDPGRQRIPFRVWWCRSWTRSAWLVSRTSPSPPTRAADAGANAMRYLISLAVSPAWWCSSCFWE